MDVTMLPRKELLGESGTQDVHIYYTNKFQSSMGQNLATLLASEGITVNTVSSSRVRLWYFNTNYLSFQVAPAMIGSTGMIPPPKSE